MRCPIHGEVDAEDVTTCPMPTRRSIAGERVAGVCGQPLVGDDGVLPGYPAEQGRFEALEVLGRGGRVSPIEAFASVFASAPETLQALSRGAEEMVHTSLEYAPNGEYLLNLPIAYWASRPHWERLERYFGEWMRDSNLSSCLVDAFTDRFFPQVTYDDHLELRTQAFTLATELVRLVQAGSDKGTLLLRHVMNLVNAAVQQDLSGQSMLSAPFYLVISQTVVSAAEVVKTLDDDGQIDWSALA
jgi:hypothetical protein